MAFFNRKEGKYQIEIGEALNSFGKLDSIENASLMNQGFEQMISKDPVQYMWQLKLFRTTEQGEANVYS